MNRSTTAADGNRAGRWLLAQAAHARSAILTTIAAGLLDAVLLVAQAALVAWIVHRAVIDAAPLAALTTALAALALVFIARAALTVLRSAAGAFAATRLTRVIRKRLYRHLTALGPVRLQRHHSGAIASTLVEQIEALEGYYANYLPQRVLAVVIPLSLIAVVLSLDLLAGLLLLIAAPLVPLFMVLIGMGAERLAQRQQDAMARISAHFLDRLRGLVTLRIFRATDAAGAAVTQAADDYRRRSLSVLRVAFLSSSALELIAAISIAVVAMYIGFSLLGFLDFGPGPELGLFAGLFILLLCPEVFLPLRRLATHYHDRATALGAAGEILAVLDDPAPALPAASDAATPPRDPQTGLPNPTPVAVTLQGVGVRFPDAPRETLADVNVTIHAGERVVISGPSGAGKSTLLHLLAGFLPADHGTITIADAPPPGAGGIAWVGQRPWLFHGSLRENLLLADPDADDARLNAALAAADLGDVVARLPAGLDTPLGEDGFGLSGGQASRLALARALLRGAPLLLLDEPTAGLDAESRNRVLATLKRLADRRRTVLLVSHDRDIIAWGDRHLTLSGGRCHEQRHA